MIRLNPEVELTVENIKKFINNHRSCEFPRLKKLYDYYNTNNDILRRQMADSTKPNNKIANPYANYITNTLTGYFMGEPVTYSSLDENIVKELNLIFEYNDEADENVELAKSASIFGAAYELLYVDEEGSIRFKQLDPTGCIPIYKDTIDEELLYFIRYYYDKDILSNKTYMYIEVLTADKMIRYKANESCSELTLIEEIPHYFKMIPIAIYKNNEEESGDFEKVITLIDAYDKLESDSLNDFEYFCDCYLALTGLNAEPEDVAKMKENRVLLLDQDSSAEWLIKDNPDASIENIKNRLDKDIHKFANCPNMSDENFASNSSGVAIKYKMVGTENVIAIKERKFKKGLQRRIELIAAINALKGSAFDWRAIDIIFTRNLPSNDTEIASMVKTLSGIVSDETLLAQIPFVEDVESELERIKNEREEKKETSPFFTSIVDYKTSAMAKAEENNEPTEEE